MNVAIAKCLALLAVSCLLSLFSSSSFAQMTNVTTSTTTASSEIGTVNADYVWSTLYVGAPTTIDIGTLTGCTLSSAEPYPGCTSGGGAGTPTDPLIFGCTSAPPVTGCTGGTPFLISAGSRNIDTRIHSVRVAGVVAAPVQPVPLGPWVPLLSSGGVLLAALWLRRRGRRRAD